MKKNKTIKKIIKKSQMEFSQPSIRKIRYRATFPIDVWIDDLGDEDRNKEEVYRIISEGLRKGNLSDNFLNLSDIERHDRF